MEFVCFPSVSVGFLHVLGFPPIVQKHYSLIGESKLDPQGVTESV